MYLKEKLTNNAGNLRVSEKLSFLYAILDFLSLGYKLEINK